MSKSEMAPIGVVGNITKLVDIIFYKIGCLPMTYLSIHRGIVQIKISMDSYSKEVEKSRLEEVRVVKGGMIT